ncbi:MAG TPA: formyltetrahydrofolate deformylase [Conexibacter sp.]|jgi:formyltetrahydrofolate deformylase|nr:formyltetrahydrofolate deformylase [Conexibacter sp.]
MTAAPTAGGDAGPPHVARLLISCPDRPGIVAAVSRFLFEHGANILDADQHSTDPAGGTFFMRMAFHLDGLDLDRAELEQAFAAAVAEPFAMEWSIAYAADRKRVAILVSREDHCLLDLLWRWRSRELDANVGLVLSNHRTVEDDAARFGVPFVHIPVAPETKPQAEAAMLEHLTGHFDLVVLARYMQILSGDFLTAVGAPIVNIHHSFLPAFAGADPYRRASERGVKIIGATAHYVTEDLDAGPIIEQDVVRVSHRDDVDALVRLGRDVERTVLARAVQRHLEDRVLVHENRTVVF